MSERRQNHRHDASCWLRAHSKSHPITQPRFLQHTSMDAAYFRQDHLLNDAPNRVRRRPIIARFH